MSAREEVLARVRRALRSSPAVPDVPRGYRRADAALPPVDELLDLLEDRLRDYRAGVRRTDDPAATVAQVLAEHGATRTGVPPGLPWDVLGAQVDAPPLSLEALDALDGVVTGCAVAVAETGTLVLDAACGRRALTLVPDLHVCVVRADQVVASVPQALARLTPDGPLTFVSGPSATSDIELSRVEGVHGPRRLEVVLVRPAAQD